MTIDEMILALVATGKFTLPSLIEVEDGRLTSKEAVLFPDEDEARQLHGLCAMHFAWEYFVQCDGLTRERPYVPAEQWEIEFKKALGRGDSAAAIKALWEAECHD